jgi:hypothetical protein
MSELVLNGLVKRRAQLASPISRTAGGLAAASAPADVSALAGAKVAPVAPAAVDELVPVRVMSFVPPDSLGAMIPQPPGLGNSERAGCVLTTAGNSGEHRAKITHRRGPPRCGAGHPLPLWLEESSSLGSGAIFGRGSGGDSGLVATSLFRVNARPRKPIAIKIAPPIISQCGNSIDESKSIYFPFAFSPRRAGGKPAPCKAVIRKRNLPIS